MSGLSFIPLGVGDAFSTQWYSTCLLVEHGDFRLLIDCPHPIRKTLHEAGQKAQRKLDLPDIDAVLITHLHADHCSGLEGLAYFNYFALQRRVTLYAHPGVSKNMWENCLSAGMEQFLNMQDKKPHLMGMEDYFDLHPLSFDQPTQVGPLEIACRPTQHHVPTTALAIASPDGSLGYSSDTSFDPDLIAWLDRCDRFIHETNYGTHTPYEKLAELPEATRKKMWIVHYPDAFDKASSVIEPLEEGKIYGV